MFNHRLATFRVRLAVFVLTVLALFLPSRASAQAIFTAPGDVQFGRVPSGDVAEATLVIHNIGNQPGSVQSYGLTLGNHANFAVLSASPSLPATLGPGELVTLHLVFRPIVAGDVSAELSVFTDSLQTPTISIVLIGAGTASCDLIATASGGGTVTPGAVTILTGVGGSACSGPPRPV